MKVLYLVLAVVAVINGGLGMFWYELGNTQGVILAGLCFTLCTFSIWITFIEMSAKTTAAG